MHPRQFLRSNWFRPKTSKLYERSFAIHDIISIHIFILVDQQPLSALLPFIVSQVKRVSKKFSYQKSYTIKCQLATVSILFSWCFFRWNWNFNPGGLGPWFLQTQRTSDKWRYNIRSSSKYPHSVRSWLTFIKLNYLKLVANHEKHFVSQTKFTQTKTDQNNFKSNSFLADLHLWFAC